MPLPIIELMFSQQENQANNPEATTPSLAEIVREETEDGRVIVRFLIDVMQGRLENSKPCHRLDAARQLLNLGFHQAQSFIDANTHASPTRKNSAPSALSAVNPSPLHQELAALIREETDNGRTTVRFLVDVMAGNLPDFKPHHRLSAAKELLRRGFDTPTPSDAGNSAAQEPDVAPDPAEKNKEAPNAWIRARLGRYADYPVGYNRYEMDPGPFNFDSYDDEDYYFDCDGAYARHYVFGGKEATSAVHKALYEFRSDARQIAKATNQDPNRCDHLIKVPADAPQSEDIYGYQALLRIFGSEQAARVAAWAAAQYHREQAALAGDYPALRPGPTTAPRSPLKIDTCTPHRTGPRRKSTRRTGLRRSWDTTRRIQRRNPGGPTSSRKDAGPGPMATRPPAMAGVHSAYDCNTGTPPTRGRPGPSPKPKKNSAPSALSAVKPPPPPI